MKKSTGTDRSITRKWRPATQAVRAGTWRSEQGETSEALFLTSGYTYDNPAEVAARFAGEATGMQYSRFQNPTVAMLEERIAAMEGAEACKVQASGMAAMTVLTAFIAVGLLDSIHYRALVSSPDGKPVYSTDVRTAFDAHTGLKLTVTFQPHVILLDIGLPDMDGYAVARHLRDNVKHAAVLLIAISGYGRIEDRTRSTSVGIDHYFVKPVDSSRLLGLIESVSSAA